MKRFRIFKSVSIISEAFGHVPKFLGDNPHLCQASSPNLTPFLLPHGAPMRSTLCDASNPEAQAERPSALMPQHSRKECGFDAKKPTEGHPKPKLLVSKLTKTLSFRGI
jgi:hypothetical protein